MELKTARLTVLIDPATKKEFEVACREADVTPSQVVRRMIREFLAPRTSAKTKAKPKPVKSRPRPLP